MSGHSIRRHKELDEITAQLTANEWCIAVAPRFSGKTTLAAQLHDHLAGERPAWELAPVAFSDETTLEAVCERIRTVMRPPMAPDRSQLPRVLIAEALEAALRSEPRRTYCLLLDNVDDLPDEVLRLLAAELHRFRNSDRFREVRTRLKCVLFGATKLRYLAAGSHSPLSGIVHTVDLHDLTPQETAALLVEHLRGQPVGRAVLDAVFDETAGHPYLVHWLADSLATSGVVEASTIRQMARQWSRPGARRRQEDACLAEATHYLERDRRSFEVVVQLLQGGRPIATDPFDSCLMCGAVTAAGERLAFRGNMFRRAMDAHLDSVRRGDYYCLHGDWDTAQRHYRLASPESICGRRGHTHAASSPGLMDLLLGLTDYCSKARSLARLQPLIANIACFLFGSDAARLWHVPVAGPASKVGTAWRSQQPLGTREDIGAIASSAARNNTSFTLSNNAGMVQGIGTDADADNWALELRYRGGMPKSWVGDGLRYVQPFLFSLLDRARRRDAEIDEELQQRKRVHELLLSLQRLTEPSQVLHKLVAGVCDDLSFECAQLCLVFPEEGTIRAVHSSGVFSTIKELTVRDVNGPDVLAAVVRSGRLCVVDECSKDVERCDPKAIRLSGLKSQVVVPLLSPSGAALGALQVGDTANLAAFTQADASMLQVVADGAALALQMAREREALELALAATGDAVVLVDASHRVTTCNDAYRAAFGTKAGGFAALTLADSSDTSSPLVRLAFDRGRALQTIRDVQGHRCIVTAAAVRDVLGRYAGGVEVIGTRSPLYGLTEALTAMLEMRDMEEVGQAIVDCVCRHLGYARARLYLLEEGGGQLVSRWCSGMDEVLARSFGKRKFVLGREDSAAAFECLEAQSPLVIIPASQAEEGLIPLSVTRDSRKRRVLVVPDSQIAFSREFEKTNLAEWLDVPLTAEAGPLGKLSIDRHNQPGDLALEDLELMALFAHWSSLVLSRALELGEARREAGLTDELRLMAEQGDPTALAWDFLLRLTTEEATAFSRAAIFLRNPHSGQLQGFLCHGAATAQDWQGVPQLTSAQERHDFISRVLREKLEGPRSDEQRAVLEALRRTVVTEDISNDAFAQGVASRTPMVVDDASSRLAGFYRDLGWEPTDHALIVPLMFRSMCEGLVYVDRAFTRASLSEADQRSVTLMCGHLAALASAYRIAEQLRGQVLALSHSGIAPMTSAHALAEVLRDRALDGESRRLATMISAEAQRGTDLVRRLLSVARLGAGRLQLGPTATDVCALVEKRTAPYRLLLNEDGIRASFEATGGPAFVSLDTALAGLTFAELAANAFLAVRQAIRSVEESWFVVTCAVLGDGATYEIVFENNGPVATEELRTRIFAPYESGLGGTGLGLWLVREIIHAHGGILALENPEPDVWRFTVTLSLCEAAEGGDEA